MNDESINDLKIQAFALKKFYNDLPLLDRKGTKGRATLKLIKDKLTKIKKFHDEITRNPNRRQTGDYEKGK